MIFVEGHLDVISLWQAGIKNVVALQGTATPKVSVLTRLAKNLKTLILCFDGDQGGRKAIASFLATAQHLSLEGLFNIKIAEMPDGMDPDEYVRTHGERAMRNLLSSATPWLDWTIDGLGQILDRTDQQMMAEVEKKLRAIVQQMTSEAVKSHYIRKIAVLLAEDSKSVNIIHDEWDKINIVAKENLYKKPEVHQVRYMAEKRLLRVYIHREDLRQRLEPLLGAVETPSLVYLVNTLKELSQLTGGLFDNTDVQTLICIGETHYIEELMPLTDPLGMKQVGDRAIEHLEHHLGSSHEGIGNLTG